MENRFCDLRHWHILKYKKHIYYGCKLTCMSLYSLTVETQMPAYYKTTLLFIRQLLIKKKMGTVIPDLSLIRRWENIKD